MTDYDPHPPIIVSILMVARNAASFINDALLTARRQPVQDIEIVVIDDRSIDATRAIAERHAAEDFRVRVLDGPGAGLSAVRNASLAAARGRWATILDSDDMLHPRHVERYLEAARRTGAEIVAGNMLTFDSGMRDGNPTLFAVGPGWHEERQIDLASYVRANGLFVDAVSLGYLKPMFDLAFLGKKGLGYDPRLRIAEDYDLVARAIAAGGRFLYLPRPTYYYRRHDSSTSHRMARSDIVAMIDTAGAAAGSDAPDDVCAAVDERRATLVAALAHAEAIEALKVKRAHIAIRRLGGNGAAWRLMLRTFREATAKRLGRFMCKPGIGDAPAVDRPVALVIGEELAGSAIERLVGQLVAANYAIERRLPPPLFEEPSLAAGLRRIDLILLADGVAREVASFALAPSVPCVAEADLADGAYPGELAPLPGC